MILLKFIALFPLLFFSWLSLQFLIGVFFGRVTMTCFGRKATAYGWDAFFIRLMGLIITFPCVIISIALWGFIFH